MTLINLLWLLFDSNPVVSGQNSKLTLTNDWNEHSRQQFYTQCTNTENIVMREQLFLILIAYLS